MAKLKKYFSVGLVLLGASLVFLSLPLKHSILSALIAGFGLLIAVTGLLRILLSIVRLLNRINSSRKRESDQISSIVNSLSSIHKKLDKASEKLDQMNLIVDRTGAINTRVSKLGEESKTISNQISTIDYRSRRIYEQTTTVTAGIQKSATDEQISVLSKSIVDQFDREHDLQTAFAHQSGHGFFSLANEIQLLRESVQALKVDSRKISAGQWQVAHRALLVGLDAFRPTVGYGRYLQTESELIESAEFIENAASEFYFSGKLSESVFFAADENRGRIKTIWVMCDSVEEQEFAIAVSSLLKLDQILVPVNSREFDVLCDNDGKGASFRAIAADSAESTLVVPDSLARKWLLTHV
ncbi:hypothetical protein [Glutamicibacter mysorens]|uniref:hypothetical protein n=1 Tax=Glutamicibacter mysorens TaxID=257984 RepID=UPI0020C5EC80|nr:hypothetical protein [Glutamicibacter mysorens]UTM47560.1 hypothetical protein XH9_01685 [Glutamicibacter mysorens]